MRKAPKQIPKTLVRFALKHRINFGLSRGEVDYFYFVRPPGTEMRTRYMTQMRFPTVAQGMAVMRRWIRDHKK
jgi:hypothetical protein